MRALARVLVAALLLTLVAGRMAAQVSDYEVKTNFENACKQIKSAFDSARTTAALDSLKLVLDSVEVQYMPRQKFLDRALYPETFGEKIADLRGLFQLTYDRVYLIQNQGIKIEELEGRILLLSARIDSLSTERTKLFAELQQNKNAVTRMRETIRRLTATMQAKDRLIFALIDSIFLPYDKDLNQIGDIQKEAITAKLMKANAAARIYDIAADNLQFLQTTELQPKDYTNLIDQRDQFANKWNGLRDKINAVSYASEAEKAGKPGKGKGAAREPVIQQTHVDSVLMDWDTRLASVFWSSLYKEFSSKQVKVLPFTDARSFDVSMRAYVDSAEAKGEDTKVFVEEVWKNRIDKEWREALSKESMLGKTRYAALDAYVSALGQAKVDLKFLLYAAIVVILVGGAWWYFGRKPKEQVPGGEETPPQA